ncbi:DoxX family protein [candidate division KSB1 bacterium]|nr:DoxX family protein [candidate division KSB1 bacterium]
MKFLDDLKVHAHWLLRVALASVFIYHGFMKFPVGGFAQAMGMPVFVALLVALAELGGGILVLVGGFTKDIVTRLGALAIVPVMLGAIFMVHLKNGWNIMNGGAEFVTVLLLVALYFVIKGNDK